jgi:hypothetical protein
MPNHMLVPPGGHAGFSQMTPASRWALMGYGSGRRSSGPKRRRKRAAKASGKRRAKRAKGSRKSKLKFGSPAWQKKYKVGRFNKKRK